MVRKNGSSLYRVGQVVGFVSGGNFCAGVVISKVWHDGTWLYKVQDTVTKDLFNRYEETLRPWVHKQDP